MNRVPKNACVIGDRVEDNNTKSKGIVIDLDVIKNEGGYEPRAKVNWYEDNSHELVDFEKEGWICEGNLTMMSPRENLLHRNH